MTMAWMLCSASLVGPISPLENTKALKRPGGSHRHPMELTAAGIRGLQHAL